MEHESHQSVLQVRDSDRNGLDRNALLEVIKCSVDSLQPKISRLNCLVKVVVSFTLCEKSLMSRFMILHVCSGITDCTDQGSI